MTKAEEAAQAKQEENSELALKIAKAIAKANGHPDPEAFAETVQEHFDEDEE